MPLDPERVAEAREWRVRAEHDLQAAERLLAGGQPLADVAMFHCQQAAEKALKAFLFWHDVAFRKTHDVEVLGQQCIQVDASLRELVERAATLTPLAWQFRYPGEIVEPSLEDAREALSLAREVMAAIFDRLPPEVAP